MCKNEHICGAICTSSVELGKILMPVVAAVEFNPPLKHTIKNPNDIQFKLNLKLCFSFHVMSL